MNPVVEKDLRHFWHPCAQMKDYEDLPPIEITRADGPFLFSSDGHRIIDAISSWWCKSLGHAHPRIREAVKKQLDRFEHVIAANTCNEILAELSERLCSLAPGFEKVFYADNGSTAVEIAMKMALQYHAQTGNPQKRHFASLANGYHGETALTLSAGDCSIYSSPYSAILTEIPKLEKIPYVSGKDSPNWRKMPEEEWNDVEKKLETLKESLAAIVFEPVVQGAGGMKIYSPDFIRRLRKWSIKNNVIMIADEIMTAFGRTGKYFACEHAGCWPDIICVSKGMTAGWAPMSAVLCPDKIFDAFYGDYFSGRAFLHSNTYCGYSLGAAAALENLKIMEEEDICAQVERREREIRKVLEQVKKETNALANIRSIGFIAAADIVSPKTGKPFPKQTRAGFRFFKNALAEGAFLRPLGDTTYVLPPLNTPSTVLEELADIASRALKLLDLHLASQA